MERRGAEPEYDVIRLDTATVDDYATLETTSQAQQPHYDVLQPADYSHIDVIYA